MKNEGWTLSDLNGELIAKGISLDEVSDEELDRVKNSINVEYAAREIEREKNRRV